MQQSGSAQRHLNKYQHVSSTFSTDAPLAPTMTCSNDSSLALTMTCSNDSPLALTKS
eukprot:CAMPEP_0114421996 /NCGR_PEP_ID=MMETSP0103-20121206/5374_1 /TAXON_ID=37642 ORGANISM="Paraphysomonas imperforata, Strain PA2" /NCGR_SAMPLE_ID=MMETSP0103 /ASSEMBLY_ACC=CAM_ASM_000201 /LENGTH=56 /DNA_ID=CAMNT_0001590551 /DNA_START=54 /DNA_END=220 /DNA_ORIENTATION=-